MKKKNRIWIFSLIVMGFVLILSNSCKKEDDKQNDPPAVTPTPTVTVPVLTTTSVSAIAITTATSGGSISSDGDGTISAKGVCWSTSASPTIADSKTSDGTGKSDFTSSITGLTPNTTYYVRAYATNSAGTGYGNAISFKTPEAVTDIDGNAYTIITIGTQKWMKENLKVTKYRNGDAIPNITNSTTWSNLTTGAYCYYDNTISNSTIYGNLYNWYAVNDTRNIAPVGWHVPSYEELSTLISYLGGASDAGGKLKDASTTYWYGPNTDATNSSGFTGLPAGKRRNTGVYSDIGYAGIWWSTTEADATNAQGRYVDNYRSNADPYTNLKSYGVSIRCVKD